MTDTMPTGDSPEAPPTDTPPDEAAMQGGTSEPAEQAPPIPEAPNAEDHGTGAEKTIRKIADDYVIPMSDEAVKVWAKTLKSEPEPDAEPDNDVDDEKPAAKGSKAKPEPKPEDAFTEYAKQVACGLYPTLATQIQAGIPTRVLLDPYIQVAIQVLGPVMTEPNWSDPKWNKALQGGIDPVTKRPAPMALNDWRMAIKMDPAHGWQNSPQAIQTAHAFGKALNDSFGGQGAPA